MNSIEQIPVLLTVRGEQIFEGVDPDETELMTEATMEVTEDGLRIVYEESKVTGMEGTTTTYLVSGPRVTLLRQGTVNSQMVFEEGKQHSSLYDTPYGGMVIDIQTSRLRHNLTERGGVMEIRYSIAVEHVVTGRNCIKVQVRRK